jgi:hypothetical protein
MPCDWSLIQGETANWCRGESLCGKWESSRLTWKSMIKRPDPGHATHRLKSPQFYFWVIFAALLAAFLVDDPQGYCKSQKRILSEEEICIHLFDDAIQAGLLYLEEEQSNGHKYFLSNRGSCSVDRTAMTRFYRHGLGVALFSDSITASIRYKISASEKTRHAITSDAVRSVLFDLTPCGEIKDTSALVE